MDTLKDFLKQPFWNQHLCHLKSYISGKLDNDGEKIQLSMPGDLEGLIRHYIRVDQVSSSDGSHPIGDDPWPTAPDGGGDSLTRIVSSDYGNDVANWQNATFTPGE